MTTVDIADIDAALGKVRAFIALFEQATPPGRRRASTLIQVRSMAGRSASARPAIRMMSGNCSWIWLSVCVRRRGTVAPMAGPNTASGGIIHSSHFGFLRSETLTVGTTESFPQFHRQR
jgi:hypothetical protein